MGIVAFRPNRHTIMTDRTCFFRHKVDTIKTTLSMRVLCFCELTIKMSLKEKNGINISALPTSQLYNLVIKYGRVPLGNIPYSYTAIVSKSALKHSHMTFSRFPFLISNCQVVCGSQTEAVPVFTTAVKAALRLRA